MQKLGINRSTRYYSDKLLGSEWRKWDPLRLARRDTSLLDPQEEATAEAARQAGRGERVREVEVAWQVASDDASLLPPSREAGFYGGSPSHMHTEFVVDGDVIHIDRLYANKSGPGRSYLEFRVFANGNLAGRGGQVSIMYGGGRNDLPAVALVGTDKVFTVDKEAKVTLWHRL